MKIILVKQNEIQRASLQRKLCKINRYDYYILERLECYYIKQEEYDEIKAKNN